MIINYIKTAFRNILKHRVLSVVNVFGLTIGLSCTILIAIYMRHELSFDKFHKKADNIYRLERIFQNNTRTYHSPHTNHLITPSITGAFPEILESVRIWPIEGSLKDTRQNLHEEQIYFCDNSFFNIFSFPLLKGNKKTVLQSPNTIVLTKEMAKKYFGETGVIGESIELQILGQNVTLQVTGLMEEMPENSHLQADLLVSYKTVEKVAPKDALDSWIAGYLYSYILVDESADIDWMRANLPGYVDENLKMYKRVVDVGAGKVSDQISIFLQPLEDIYLFADVPYSIGPAGDIDKLYTAGAIAFLILIIACINYINLSTAKSLTRSKEVGLRKVFGANRKKVIIQFITESILLAFIALILSMVIMESIMPVFKGYMSKDLSIGYFDNPLIIIVLIGFALFVGLLAGTYPAIHISSFSPASAMNEKGQSSGGSNSILVRKGLVIFQFAISVALIIAVFIMNEQLQFMVNKDPGFKKDKVLVVPISDSKLQSQMTSIKKELKTISAVQSVGQSNKVFGDQEFGDRNMRRRGTPEDQAENVKIMNVDADFIPTMEIELASGRNYSRSFKTDTEEAFVLNEKAIKILGFASPDEAVGKEVVMSVLSGGRRAKIIGVMKDFHYRTMESEINPMAFLYNPESVDKIFVKLSPESKISESVDQVKSILKNYSPNFTFNYSFLDVEFNTSYQNEIKMRKLFMIFTFLAIFIACMGLFGLASFMTEQKTKEIGIRKAIGASSSKIIIMLSSQFLKWILFSNIIAWPVIYYLLNQWLQNYAYHIEINLMYFVIASVIALVIAQLTVFYKAYNAAMTNPVNSLRYE